MTAWSIITELELDDDAIERVRTVLVDCLEQEIGSRPRTRTIRSDSLQAALKPPAHFTETRPHAADLPMHGTKRRP